MAPVKKKKKLSSADHRLISATETNQQKKPLGSVMTSFGRRRSVRVAKKTNKRILRKIWICTDVLMDTLPFFGRRQLGLKMALISPRFNALVDKHFDGKSELTISRRVIIRKIGTKPKQFAVMKSKPMPDHPLPNKILFNYLRIDYIDHSVIKFLRAKHFDKGINLDLQMPYLYNAKKVQPNWDDFVREIWPIFAPNIRHLSFSNGHHLVHLRLHASPSFLSNFDIISIHSAYLLPDSIADDGPYATIGEVFFKWLHTPRSDGKPKRLSCCECGHTSKTKRLIKSFKEKFLDATTCFACYIIRIDLDFVEPNEIGPFELVNERTNEKLTLEKEDEDEEGDDEWEERWIMKRWQIGKTADIQWEDEKRDKLNNVDLSLCGFGPLSPPKVNPMNAKGRPKMNPGPSGQQQKKK